MRTWGTPQGFLESWREPEEETADLSTALRSGRDDKVVRVLELLFHGKGAVASPQLHCRFGPVLMNKPERVHTGEQINFPHLAKNGRDMGHPQLRLGKSLRPVHSSLNLAPGKSLARDDKAVTGVGADFPWKKAVAPPQLCHLDRSEAQWRDLRFPLPVFTQTREASSAGMTILLRSQNQFVFSLVFCRRSPNSWAVRCPETTMPVGHRRIG